MDARLETQIAELAARLRESRYGAGISTESGIPDFRGPQGLWKRMRPIALAEFLSNPHSRREYRHQKIEGWPQMRDAAPNAGHRALARLQEAGLLEGVVTQNIDGRQVAAKTQQVQMKEAWDVRRNAPIPELLALCQLLRRN